MNGVASEWQPLSLLGGQFRANVAALRSRMPELADQVGQLSPTPRFITAAGDSLRIVVQTPAGLQVLPDPAPPSAAKQVAVKLYPSGRCTHPVMVAGLDQGWIWQTLYEMPVSVPSLPGHRPALFFLTGDIERLWTAMHLHDWRRLLADERVRLFVGPDAVMQVKRAMIDQPQIPWPRIAVTVEPSLWPAGESIDALNVYVQGVARERIDAARRQSDAAYAWATPPALVERLRSGKRLRILGITSRFTTFLQYSMRDWLDAFARMGHETRIVLEGADHEALNSLIFSEAIAGFRPDLLVLIDHHRGEFRGIPDNLPVVMWVQDHLPHIFKSSAGAAQGPRDYCLGFGRQECVDRFGYPIERFLPSRIGVNADRFAPCELTAGEIERFGCDVSYVSNAGTPAETILAEAMERYTSPLTRKLLADIFERLRAIYAAGGAITEAADITDLIQQSLIDTRTSVPDITPLVDLFLQRINNALFRHQSLGWLVDGLGDSIDLRIYGKGWESHPTFNRFARGVADNRAELSAIYRASRINLQVIPHGAVHQRLSDGLSAGGFFLIRHCDADEVEPIYRATWDWCLANDVRSDEELIRRATPEVRQRLDELAALKKRDPFSLGVPLVESMALAADGGYTCSARSLWPDDFGQVSFRSADELCARVRHFLNWPDERREIASSMRQVVLDKLTYTSITNRLLSMIADDQERQGQRQNQQQPVAA